MSERKVQRGVKFELITESVSLPNGRCVEMDYVQHPGAAAVVPFLDQDRILMIRQYRFVTGGEIMEIPAGKLDPGETPEGCAARELVEETGYRAGRIVRLGAIWASPGFTDEIIHLFAAFDLEKSVQQLEPDEIIELRPMPLTQAIKMLRASDVSDGKSLIALMLAAEELSRGNLFP
ncbi:MAG: NUDIX hydrolase [Myxococcota bacterium]